MADETKTPGPISMTAFLGRRSADGDEMQLEAPVDGRPVRVLDGDGNPIGTAVVADGEIRASVTDPEVVRRMRHNHRGISEQALPVPDHGQGATTATLTQGERMVWAAAFERGIFEGQRSHHAAVNARAVVDRMRAATDAAIDSETRSMLEQMLADPVRSGGR